MGTYRMYTENNNLSKWEKINIEGNPNWIHGIETTQIKFDARPVGILQDWHPVPQRQFVIILSGQLEIGFGDGSKKIFGPGDARLVEDITGKGHTTVAIGDEPCITATIVLK
jgi:quercetin dioxygenase-like cupin family protein